jgi:hypothetical protein
VSDHGTLVGVLGGARVAAVDSRGTVTLERAGWRLTWWVGADDRWHLAARDVAVRQSRVGNMPVVRTAMRVPGGDAVQHVYGARDVAAVEITNDSPAPFVVALVVEGAAQVALDGRVVVVDGRAAFLTPRAPARWAATTDGSTERVVTSGQASDGIFPPRTDRGARIVAAFLYPAAHRTTFRAAVGLSARGLSEGELDLGALPDADTTARGWAAQLERGARVLLPDTALQDAVDAARADLLLAGQAWMPDPAVVAALEDWGHETEALAAQARLPRRSRRRLGKRSPPPGDWQAVVGAARTAGAPLLLALRGMLLQEWGRELRLAPVWPEAWRGLPLDMRCAPTRLGPVSYSVRWHGDRAALLWEAPVGARVSAPAFDPSWSSDEPKGEALLQPREGAP